MRRLVVLLPLLGAVVPRPAIGGPADFLVQLLDSSGTVIIAALTTESVTCNA